MRYTSFLGRRHKSRWTHSPQTRSRNKMAAFWCYFRDFVTAQKIEDLTESKNVFAELFQIISRFLLAKKNLGVMCTLIYYRHEWFYWKIEHNRSQYFTTHTVSKMHISSCHYVIPSLCYVTVYVSAKHKFFYLRVLHFIYIPLLTVRLTLMLLQYLAKL